MSDGVSRDIGRIEEGLKQLSASAEEFIKSSGYTKETHNDTTFQSINGQAAVSVGKAVTEVSALDTLANQSILNWQKVTENLIVFVTTDKESIESADNAQG